MVTIYMIANISNLKKPIMPDASEKIKKMLGLADYKWDIENIDSNIKINELELLFERIDEKKSEDLLDLRKETRVR